MTRSQPSEIEFHRAVAELLDWVVIPPALWTTFPAGWTAMRKGAAGRLKGCGLRAGMPDILIFHAGRTLGLELKTQLGHLSHAQVEMFTKLAAADVRVHVVCSLAEVLDVLTEADIPMRKVSLQDAPPRP